jgi:GNAT superfamily N-acetyltransferase
MIRAAAPADVDAILALVVELAIYEREPDAVEMTAAMLHTALFDDRRAECEVADVGGSVVGFALWYPTFSTWTGVGGIHLEDLYVRPEHRGEGHGRALLARLAAICTERGWARLEWNVLTWNAPAIGFYRSLGAEPLEEWRTFRLVGEARTALGS